MRRHALLCGTAWLSLTGCAASPPASRPAATAPPVAAIARSVAATPARLAEGVVPVTTSQSTPAGHAPSAVRVVRVWTEGEGTYKWMNRWRRAEFGDKPVLEVRVGDTPYSLLVVGGRFAPYLWDGHGAWRLEGLEKVIHSMSHLHVTDRGVELEAAGGDMHAFLRLAFEPGLTVEYRERWDGA